MINLKKLGFVAGPLLSALLVSGCVWQSDYDALQAKYNDLQKQSQMQADELAAAKAQQGRLTGAIKYTVNSDLLFASGSWTMSESGKSVIARLATKLAPTQQNKLVVNGYTDNVPVGPGLAAQGVPDNQVLSQKRAEAVMEFLISTGVKPDLVSAVGHGENDPVQPNDTAKGRAANRRVEITLAQPAM